VDSSYQDASAPVILSPGALGIGSRDARSF